MKYKFFFIVIFYIVFNSCKTSVVNKRDNYYVSTCSSYRIENDNQITWSSINISEANIPLNQVRYCTRNPDVLGKLFYLELGHWNGVYINKNEKSVIIFWNNVKIKGIDKVFSFGTTSYYDCLSSIVVYDEYDNDMLAPESKYRDILLENFRNRINTYGVKIRSDYYQYREHEIFPLYKELHNKK